jgi:hypothetical protein
MKPHEQLAPDQVLVGLCPKHPYDGEHEWTQRTDSMGDPYGRYGEETWQVTYCCWCGIEQQEIEE